MTTSPAPETPRPVTVPTLQDRARVLEPLGWSGRAAEWIALVALHTGVFTRSQWCHFFDHANREAAPVFVRALLDKQLAIEDERAIFPGGARAVLLTGKALYRALGIPDVRSAGSTRRPIVSSSCNNSPTARPPRRRREGRLTASRSGPPSG